MTEEQIASVVVAGIKAATTPLLERIAAQDARIAMLEQSPYIGATKEFWTGLEATVGNLRERVAVVEVRAAAPGPMGPQGLVGEKGDRGDAGAPGEPGPSGERGPIGESGANGKDGADGLHGKDGANGLDGKDGAPGRDGRDGTLEALKAVQSEDLRTITLCFKNGDPIEGGVLRFPVTLYRGVYVHGKTYDAGDSVTYQGGTWIAKEDTSDKPGDGATAWQLAVKAGREGKPGTHGKDGAPGLHGKDGRDLTGTGWAAPRG